MDRAGRLCRLVTVAVLAGSVATCAHPTPDGIAAAAATATATPSVPALRQLLSQRRALFGLSSDVYTKEAHNFKYSPLGSKEDMQLAKMSFGMGGGGGSSGSTATDWSGAKDGHGHVPHDHTPPPPTAYPTARPTSMYSFNCACSNPGANAVQHCCAAGTYKHDSTNGFHLVDSCDDYCQKCPVGTYAVARRPGHDDDTQPCPSCPPGKASRAGVRDGCDDCPMGFAPSATEDGCTVCTDKMGDGFTCLNDVCPPGTHKDGCDPENPEYCSRCTACAAGQFQQYFDKLTCDTCGNVPFSGATQCPDGGGCAKGSYYGPTEEACTQCPDGWYQHESNVGYHTPCKQCPSGFSSGTGAYGCSNHPNGCGKELGLMPLYDIRRERAEVCTRCQAGKQQDYRAVNGNHFNAFPADGRDWLSTHWFSALYAALDLFEDPHRTAGPLSYLYDDTGLFGAYCVSCPVGQYREATGGRQCTPCPQGHICPYVLDAGDPGNDDLENSCLAHELNMRDKMQVDVSASCFHTEKVPCPSGTYMNQEGYSVSRWADLQNKDVRLAIEWRVDGSTVAPMECFPCPPHQWTRGQTGAATCTYIDPDVIFETDGTDRTDVEAWRARPACTSGQTIDPSMVVQVETGRTLTSLFSTDWYRPLYAMDLCTFLTQTYDPVDSTTIQGAHYLWSADKGTTWHPVNPAPYHLGGVPTGQTNAATAAELARTGSGNHWGFEVRIDDTEGEQLGLGGCCGARDEEHGPTVTEPPYWGKAFRMTLYVGGKNHANAPTLHPTASPTGATLAPTASPSTAPSARPTARPTLPPTTCNTYRTCLAAGRLADGTFADGTCKESAHDDWCTAQCPE